MTQMTLTGALTRVLFAAGCGLLSSAAISPASADRMRGEKVVPKAQIKFVKINPAIRMATVYGDKSSGAHGTFGKIPARFKTPFHTHSAAYHGVVLKGVMTNPFKGQKNPPRMAPGSYWHVPANSVHATACVSKTPCEFYFHSLSKFDFRPAK